MPRLKAVLTELKQSTSRLVPAWLFARARGGAALFPIWFIGLVCAIRAPSDLIDVPLSTMDRVGPRPLVAAAVATVAGLGFSRPGSLEARTWRLICGRLVWWSVIAGAYAGLLPWLAFHDSAGAQVSGSRAALLALGAVSVMATIGHELWWLMPLCCVGATLLFGSRSEVATPESWAILLYPPTEPVSWTVASVLAVAGMTTYAVRDSS